VDGWRIRWRMAD